MERVLSLGKSGACWCSRRPCRRRSAPAR